MAGGNDLNMRIRKRVTALQVEANRRNSLKATGPKTQAGKVHSSRNSWKHGILSAQVLVPDGLGEEDAEKFGALFAALREDFQPCGAMEDILVQQIAIGYWRLARVHRCEAGEIAKNSESVEYNFADWERQTVAENDPHLMRRSSRGLARFSATLDAAESELKRGSCLSDDTVSYLSRFEPEVYVFFRRWNLALKEFMKDPDLDKHRTMAIETMKSYISEYCRPVLEDLAKHVNAKESIGWRSDLLSASLPDLTTVDRLLRYETSIQRRLDRSLAHLERLQRRRMGETVPPPVRVQIER